MPSHARGQSGASRFALRRRRIAERGDEGRRTAPHITRYVSDGVVGPAPASTTPAEALRFTRSGPGRMALLFYPTPTPEEITELAAGWDLHPLLVEDLLHAHQRPKLERYGDVLFLVARSARYVDEREEVDLAEFHIVVRPHAVAVFCQDGRLIDGADGLLFDADETEAPRAGARGLFADERLLRLGSEAAVYRLLDAIVDSYGPVLQGMTLDREQIERQVFSGDSSVTERIYRLTQEVIDVQHATSSLAEVLSALRSGFGKYGIADELQAYLQDVADHLTRTGSQVVELRDALTQILDVNATLVAQRQNEDMKKISGWAAILFAPTLIAAVYGMNFDAMPELHWPFGYPAAVLLMVAFAAGLYLVFKWRKWM